MTSRRADRIVRLRRAVDPKRPSSMVGRARARRWDRFLERYPDISSMRVLDLGGTADTWRTSGVRPAHVTIMNVSDHEPAREPWISALVGDACKPPMPRREMFDLVYSNSVIEHIGGHEQRKRFASAVRDLAPRYWIQTPNRYFPIEPHWLFPGFQFLPVGARARLSKSWPLGWYSLPNGTKHTRVQGVLEIELIGVTELSYYFPDASIIRERWLGLTKSIMAVR